jgi:hypothetical protein
LNELAQELVVTNNNLVLAGCCTSQELFPLWALKNEQYLENTESVKIQLSTEQMEILKNATA